MRLLTFRPEFARPISNPASDPQIVSIFVSNILLLENLTLPRLIVRMASDINIWVIKDSEAEKRGNSKPYFLGSYSHLRYKVIDVEAIYQITRLDSPISDVELAGTGVCT